jgi:predicted RNase H-like nuclease (RuvC/YqgF family)
MEYRLKSDPSVVCDVQPGGAFASYKYDGCDTEWLMPWSLFERLWEPVSEEKLSSASSPIDKELDRAAERWAPQFVAGDMVRRAAAEIRRLRQIEHQVDVLRRANRGLAKALDEERREINRLTGQLACQVVANQELTESNFLTMRLLSLAGIPQELTDAQEASLQKSAELRKAYRTIAKLQNDVADWAARCGELETRWADRC